MNNNACMLPIYPKKRALAAFKKHLQWTLITQLKPKKGSPCESGKILIPESLFDFFKEYFKVTGRFRENLDLINFLQIENIVFFNEKNYCLFEKSLMRVRVARTQIKYLNKDLVLKEISCGYYLFAYQFIRRDLSALN